MRASLCETLYKAKSMLIVLALESLFCVSTGKMLDLGTPQFVVNLMAKSCSSAVTVFIQAIPWCVSFCMYSKQLFPVLFSDYCQSKREDATVSVADDQRVQKSCLFYLMEPQPIGLRLRHRFPSQSPNLAIYISLYKLVLKTPTQK